MIGQPRITALGLLLIGMAMPLVSVSGFESPIVIGTEAESGGELLQAHSTPALNRIRQPYAHPPSRNERQAFSVCKPVLRIQVFCGHCIANHRIRNGCLAPIRC